MQIIEEEDEKVEIQDVDIMEEVEELYEKINSKYDETQQQKSNKYLQHMRHSGFKKARQIKTMVYKEFLNPMRRSLKLFKFYPSVILKSCEIFSYLLFITLILPNLALIQYRFTNENHLVSLMAFFWIIYTIFILKFHKTLQENQVFWHIAGILCKFFGYLCKLQSFFVKAV